MRYQLWLTDDLLILVVSHLALPVKEAEMWQDKHTGIAKFPVFQKQLIWEKGEMESLLSETKKKKTQKAAAFIDYDFLSWNTVVTNIAITHTHVW
jgi:hypothetical protein